MVVTAMTGQISQFNSENASELYKSLSLQLCNGGAEESSHLPVVVKNLTTDGVILEILHLESGLQTENLKGVEGQLKIIDQDDQVMIEIPGKILWTRNREGATGVTVGLELLGPIPLPVRQTLEAHMDIGAKDMKVLWDYWDEVQDSAISASPPNMEISVPAVLTGTETCVPAAPEQSVGFNEQADTLTRKNWLYWAGFGGILSGLALQFSQSEYLGISGLAMMFLGSLLVAWKSIMSMRQLPSNDQLEKDGA